MSYAVIPLPRTIAESSTDPSRPITTSTIAVAAGILPTNGYTNFATCIVEASANGCAQLVSSAVVGFATISTSLGVGAATNGAASSAVSVLAKAGAGVGLGSNGSPCGGSHENDPPVIDLAASPVSTPSLTHMRRIRTVRGNVRKRTGDRWMFHVRTTPVPLTRCSFTAVSFAAGKAAKNHPSSVRIMRWPPTVPVPEASIANPSRKIRVASQ